MRSPLPKRISAVLAILFVPLFLCAQQVGGSPPEEEHEADLVLRIRLVQAQPGKLTAWPDILKDLKSLLTVTGRYENFKAVEGHRVPTDFGKEVRLKLEDLPMRVELTSSKKTEKGYPVVLRWMLTPKGKKAVKILERATHLQEGKFIIPYVSGTSGPPAPLFLVLDIAPSWDKDPVAAEMRKRMERKSR